MIVHGTHTYLGNHETLYEGHSSSVDDRKIKIKRERETERDRYDLERLPGRSALNLRRGA